MAATFEEEQLARLQAVAARHPGQKQIQTDGSMVTFAELDAQIEHYKSLVAQQSGARARAASIDLSGS